MTSDLPVVVSENEVTYHVPLLVTSKRSTLKPGLSCNGSTLGIVADIPQALVMSHWFVWIRSVLYTSHRALQDIMLPETRGFGRQTTSIRRFSSVRFCCNVVYFIMCCDV